MGNAGFLSSTIGFAHDASNVLDGSLAVSFSYVASMPLSSIKGVLKLRLLRIRCRGGI